MFRPIIMLGAASIVLAGLLLTVSPRLEASPRLEFTRMIAHWSDYADPGYLPFIDEVQPEIVQVGFYGAHFWSLSDTAHGGGYPANLPVRGHRECSAWFARLNTEIHKRGAKVVGHMNVKFLVGDPESPEGPRGFFQFYKNLWDEATLGPKPVADPIDFLEKDSQGKPISNKTYSIGGMAEYWACLNNPHWRAVLKAWVRFGLAQGVDGFISNYFYRHDCHCQYCVAGFKDYLRQRFTPAELKKTFGIDDLQTHVFEEIGAWHDAAKSTPLRLEALRFSQIANKDAFDDVFVRYGRSLKPDLIVAQWNHLGNFDQISGDERCLLPSDRWGQDENYLWYSTGGVTNPTDLKEGNLGEATLQMRYIRGAFDDKPFTLGRYENVRMRSAIAELAANGGAPMGFYTSFKDPDSRREIVRYYGFLKRYEALFRANRPHAEALLLFPRARVHQGDVASVDRFRKLGRRLLDEHLLFDVLPDELASPADRARYAKVYDPGAQSTAPPDSQYPLPPDRSRFNAPATVRVSASRPATGDELTLHFVNYNREEPADPKKTGNGIRDEKPVAAPGFAADVLLPAHTKVKRLTFLAPEKESPTELAPQVNAGHVKIHVPEFLVYGVLRIELSPAP